ncbi:hypothetical protein AGMMS49944_11610 [Spirochaetia bacterium]|nr:hypothetical protein AGMMS49944_11610 [Spirochaetia bacterium]
MKNSGSILRNSGPYHRFVGVGVRKGIVHNAQNGFQKLGGLNIVPWAGTGLFWNN